MINISKKKENSKIQILIECNKNRIKINGKEVSFPIDLNTLKEIFGEPSKQEHDLLWEVIWDDLGIYTEFTSGHDISDIKLLLYTNHKLKHLPEKFFNGQIKVHDREITNEKFKEFNLKKYKVIKLAYKREVEIYSIYIGKNFDYKEEIPKDKYVIGRPDEDVLEFKDFGFKLSILQELMYHKELLVPQFDLFEFVEWYDKRIIDVEKEGYEPIPEVTQYFKDLQIPKKYASEITEIYQDGGNEIYMQLLRFGSGWEDYWDIENVEDARQFPNLKKVVLCYAKNNVLEDLYKIGIKAEWG